MIKIKALCKKYKKEVLKDINITIEPNKIVGLMGRNGSGKTTLLKILGGITNPTSGEVEIFDKHLGVETKEIVSFMMDENVLFKGMKVKEALNFYKLFFLDFNEGNARIMLSEFNIDLENKINTLSKGELEKLNVALTFSRKAKVYLLDEPLSSIDPIDREKVIETILNNFEKGSIMIISTNIIGEIENILDEVIFLKDGSVYLKDTLKNIREKGNIAITDLFKEEL